MIYLANHTHFNCFGVRFGVRFVAIEFEPAPRLVIIFDMAERSDLHVYVHVNPHIFEEFYYGKGCEVFPDCRNAVGDASPGGAVDDAGVSRDVMGAGHPGYGEKLLAQSWPACWLSLFVGL